MIHLLFVFFNKYRRSFMMKKLVLLICFFVLTIALYGCGQTSGKVDKPPIASVKHSKG